VICFYVEFELLEQTGPHHQKLDQY
jgi:hypothetical protein